MQPEYPRQNVRPEAPQQQLLGYDTNGQPLYGTPATTPPPQPPVASSSAQDLGSAFQTQSTTEQTTRQPTVSRASRHPDSPRSASIQAEVKEKHEQSVRDYPSIDLSDTEYVIMTVNRHDIGIAAPVIGGIIIVCLIIAGVIVYPSLIDEYAVMDAPNVGVIALVGFLLAAIVAGFTYMSMWLYRANKLILTNESLIRNMQVSLFSKRFRTVSLGDVGGVSYRQTGILQTMLRYGTVHVNTRGNDNIYRMSYAVNPREQVTTIERAVEEFKERFGVDHRF